MNHFKLEPLPRALWIEFPQQQIEMHVGSLLGHRDMPFVPDGKNVWSLTFYRKGFDNFKNAHFEDQVDMFCTIDVSGSITVDFIEEIHSAVRSFSAEYEQDEDMVISQIVIQDEEDEFSEVISSAHQIELTEKEKWYTFGEARKFLERIPELYNVLAKMQKEWQTEAIEAETVWQTYLNSELKEQQQHRSFYSKKRSQHLLKLADTDNSNKKIQTIKNENEES